MTETAEQAPDVPRASTALAVREDMRAPALVGKSELDDLWRVAELLAKSGIYKDARQAGQAFAKVMYGRDLGLSPTEAMSSIHLIEGKPELSSHFHGARIKESPKYDYRVKKLTNDACVLHFYEILEDGTMEFLGESEYTTADADLAGLRKPKGEAQKESNHVKYPRNMLFARAMTNGIEWYCPDVTGGLRTYALGELEAGTLEGAVDGSPEVEGGDDEVPMDRVPWPDDAELAAEMRALVDEINAFEANTWTPAALQMLLGNRTEDQHREIRDRLVRERDDLKAAAAAAVEAEEEIHDAEVVDDEPADEFKLAERDDDWLRLRAQELVSTLQEIPEDAPEVEAMDRELSAIEAVQRQRAGEAPGQEQLGVDGEGEGS